MGARRSTWVFLALAALCTACPKGQEPRDDAARGPDASVATSNESDAGAYEVTAEALDRFIRYQERALPLHAEMLQALGRAERADAGDAEGVAVLERHAQALQKVRAEVGLTSRDVAELEAIVGDVIARRAAVPPDEAARTVADMEALAAKLPPEQRAEFDATTDALKKQYAEAADLVPERQRHGDRNVDLVLAREKELTDQWNRAVRLFARH